MRRISLACVTCFLLSAAAAWGSPGDTALHGAPAAAVAAASHTKSHQSVLFGQRTVQPRMGRTVSGMAHAFAFRSRITGTTSWIRVYLDRRSGANTLMAAIYRDANGRPGSRIATGSAVSATAGAWNSVKLDSAAIKAGKMYWLVVLGKGGALDFREGGAARCADASSYERAMTSLPASWSGGTRSSVCQISAVVLGKSRSVRKNAPLATTTLTGIAATGTAIGGGSTNSGSGSGSSGGGTSTLTLPALPPLNTGAPTIGGTAQQGRTLTASNGTWIDGPTSFSFQWEDCNTLGILCTSIGGATLNSYVLKASDVGHTVRVVVTATNSGGSTSATSSQTGTVAAASAGPGNTTAPVVTGSSVQGHTFSTTNGSWSNNPTSYGYQWQDCNTSGASCSNISGATSATYTLQAGDVGDTVRSVVTATNGAGSASQPSAVSAPISSSGRTGNATLLGDQNQANNADSNAAGIAQAFAYTAAASGTTTDIQLYVNSGTTATELFLGLYSDNGGKPGSLLATGSISSPTAGAWNDVTVGSATVTAGTSYWIGLLGTGGQLFYPDTAAGSGASYVNSTANLTSLPQTYAPGNEYAVSPASTYVVGVTTSSPSAPSNTSPPTINGQAVQGQTLSAGTGSWSGAPTSYAYQWQDCNSSGASCSSISGATASSYTLQASDVGDTVRVAVTASNAGGSGSASSSQTAVVTSSGTSGSGQQIYISQSGAGASSGADCGDAKPVSFFNSSSDWGSGAGQIGPGVTVDLCGTISTALSVQGSGTSSSPITIYWTSGSTMSSRGLECRIGDRYQRERLSDVQRWKQRHLDSGHGRGQRPRRPGRGEPGHLRALVRGVHVREPDDREPVRALPRRRTRRWIRRWITGSCSRARTSRSRTTRSTTSAGPCSPAGPRETRITGSTATTSTTSITGSS